LHSQLIKLLKYFENFIAGERPFACSICDRRFAAKAAMQKHELTHDKSRYEGRRYVKFMSSQFAIHVKMHIFISITYLSFLGEPQYECDLCGKFWTRFSFVFST
jgi:hypothetical protein